MQREKIIDQAESALSTGILESEKRVLKDLLKLLNQFDKSGGRIVFNADTVNLINQAEQDILNALNKSGYNSRVNQYLRDFDKIKTATISQQKAVNGIEVSTRLLNNIQKSAIQQTQNILLGNGLNSNVIQPVKDILLESAASGMTISQAEAQLRNVVSGRLQAYSETHSKQSILSYDGMLQSRIQKEYDLDALSYEGSLISTSAGQCAKWTEMGEIPIKDIEAELKWARDNVGTKYNGYKIVPLIEGTNKENFAINRGHWGCRHSITAIRL